ncbi:MAG: GNAT family N-acetyltransferase [Betaproteobacteria bacterium]
MAEITLTTERLLIATPSLDKAQAMLDFTLRNRDHLQRWNPPEPPGLHTLAYWETVVGKSAAAFDAGTAIRFWISPREEPKLIIGSIGFSQIARGPFCSCVTGYQIDAASEGKGLMSEALRTAMRYMFEEQKLHRIGANYRPENVRSGRLLAKLGFRIEGFAKDYLFIDGDWRDHILTSVTNSAFDKTSIKMG